MSLVGIRRSKLDDQGLVSITVTMVFILVITLIVLGFSQVSQRNGRIALDRELSSQAAYAAEAGINDVRNKIAKYIDDPNSLPQEAKDAGLPFPAQDTCTGVYTKNSGRVYSSSDDVKYTCLLVSQPPNIQGTNMSDQSLIWPIEANGGTQPTLNSLKLEWTRAKNTSNITDASNCPSGAKRHIAATSWRADCPFGMVQVDIVKNDEATLQDASAAAAATMTLFLYPHHGTHADGMDYAYEGPYDNMYGTKVSQGRIGFASCGVDKCTANITGLNFPKGYIRVKAFYQTAATVTIDRQGVGPDGTLQNAQVLIDVTAKAQDVVKRYQARGPLRGASAQAPSKFFSDYSLETAQSICKRFNISPRLGNTNTGIPAGSGCP